MTTKHRLKVLRPEDDPDEPPRPPWHWIGFGTVATFAAWLPLAYLAQAVASQFVSSRIGDIENLSDVAAKLSTLPAADQTEIKILLWILPAAALALAAAAGGFLVGRWGENAGVREAALAGATTVLVTAMLTCVSSSASWVPLVGLLVAAPMAAAGGKLGLRRRARLLA